MSRFCQLIMVTGNNNNKFYNMKLEGDSIVVEYGRVGCKPTQVTYPQHKWDSLYSSKVRKGYKDITSLKAESIVKDTKQIDDIQVRNIVDYLIQRSRTQISSNYLVSYKDVTQKQIDEAQNTINNILQYRKRRIPVSQLNEYLLKLYGIIPRKMNNVKDHLLTEFDNNLLKSMIKHEQELLDNMQTQVAQNTTDIDGDKTVLELAGIQMTEATDEEQKLIKSKLGKNKDQFVRAFKVINSENEDKFNEHLKQSKNKKTELFWHGSRTENWWSILSTGLRIRPSNAVYTGSMFGDGIYFADKAQKSIGYTSLSGSYWAKGGDRKAFLCLYEVHVGKQKIVNEHTSQCYDFNKENINADSVYAKAGVSLKNNEYIIYDSYQCTPRFLVEISD